MNKKNVKIVELWLPTNAECILEEKARTKNVSLNEIEEEHNNLGAWRHPQLQSVSVWRSLNNSTFNF